MTNTLPLVGLHKFDFSLKSQHDQAYQPQTIAEDIGPILSQLFGLSFEDFRPDTRSAKAGDRGYTHCATYHDQVFIYYGSDSWNAGKVRIDICGKAFDDGGRVDLEQLQSLLRTTVKEIMIREVHGYADDPGDTLKFPKLWKCIDKYRVTSGHYTPSTYPGSKKGDARTIYFGKKTIKNKNNQVLAIYEKGVKEPESGRCIDHVRVEVRYWGTKARMMVDDWLAGKPLHEVIKGTISAMVQFRTLEGKDDNASRLPLLPEWVNYLEGIQPIKYVLRKDPDAGKSLRKMHTIALSQLQRIQERFDVSTFNDLLSIIRNDDSGARRRLDIKADFQGDQQAAYLALDEEARNIQF